MYDWLAFFEESMERIRIDYIKHSFFVERDFVWSVQKYLADIIDENNLPYLIFNDYPIEKESPLHRSKAVDLAVIGKGIAHTDILNGKGKAELIAEFKFEPSRLRADILTHKLPAVEWRAVNNDIERIRRFTEDHKAKTGVAVLVDEFGRFKQNGYAIGNQSKWFDWGNFNSDKFNISILWTSINEKNE